MFTLEASCRYSDPAKRREEKRRQYLANREKILAGLAAKRRAAEALGVKEEARTEPCIIDADQVADIRSLIERDRRETLEGIRLRLIWASSAGGDEGAVARTAVSVIRFAEGEGKRWTDRALRTLHRRLSLAEGLTPARFDAARQTIARELFVPL